MERKEFESRITRMRPQLLQLAIRYLNNGDDAEDVVQDTLLKLWFLRDRLDDYRSVDSLASVITRHLAISCIRSRRSGMVDIDELYDVKGDESTEMKIIRGGEPQGDIRRNIGTARPTAIDTEDETCRRLRGRRDSRNNGKQSRSRARQPVESEKESKTTIYA